MRLYQLYRNEAWSEKLVRRHALSTLLHRHSRPDEHRVLPDQHNVRHGVHCRKLADYIRRGNSKEPANATKSSADGTLHYRPVSRVHSPADLRDIPVLFLQCKKLRTREIGCVYVCSKLCGQLAATLRDSKRSIPTCCQGSSVQPTHQ